MSDKEARTGTTRISKQEIKEDRKEADQLAEQQREERLREAEERGKRERVATRLSEIDEEAEDVEQAVARKTPAEERAEARARAPGHLLLLLLIFLICYLIAAATGRPDIISFPRTRDTGQNSGLQPSLDNGAVGNGSGNLGVAPQYQVAPVFNNYYIQGSGTRLLGRPISDLMIVNGLESQWFERGRLERHPELAGTPHEIMPGLVGVEYTQGVPFPNQQFLVSTPGVVYFQITNHSVRQQFYDFWVRNGGVDAFGYPISEEVQELLPTTGKVHTVQYFERARFELHPENAGTDSEIQLGLIGRSLYLKDPAPNIVSAAKPTPVPVPVAAP